MAPVDESIALLSKAVMKEAQSEAEQTLSRAKEDALKIQQKAQDQAETERKGILERASQEEERIRRQAIATAEMRARTLQLKKREELLKGVFEEAHKQLGSLQQWSDYDRIVRKLLREALTHLETSSALVRADEVTLQYLTDELLEEISKELDVKIQVKGTLEQGTGVIVETEDGRRRFDNTLETRLDRMQDALRAPVYRLLVGDYHG
jgi:V/A-type H+/Na+-transporting ATPase subunit E